MLTIFYYFVVSYKIPEEGIAMIPQNKSVRLRRGNLRFILFFCFCISITIFLLKPEFAFNKISIPQHQTKQDIQILEPGKTIERQLEGGESHFYQIYLDKGQFLHLIVEQKGIDVVVTAIGPDSQEVVEVDSPTGSQGQESLTLLSELLGLYRVEVCSFEREAPSGSYEIKIEELRVATQKEIMHFSATKSYQEAEQLQTFGVADSLRKALTKLEKALMLWNSLGDSVNEAYTLDYMGQLYNSLGEKQKALEFFKKALPIFQSSGQRKSEAITLNDIGTIYWALSEYQIALKYYDQSLAIKRSLADSSGMSNTFNNIGAVYRALGENQKALEFLNNALAITRAMHNRTQEGICLYNIADLYDEWGEKQKALDYFNQAHALFQQLKNLQGESHTLKGIGSVYFFWGEYKIALDYYERAVELNRTTGNRFSEAYLLSNIGKIYEGMRDYQKALDYFNQALLITQAIGDRSGEAHTLNSIGKIFSRQGEHQKALEYHQKALPIAQEIGNKYVETGIYINIGWDYSQSGELQGSLNYFNKGLSLARTTGDLEAEAKLLRGIAWTERELGDFAQAQNHISQAIRIVDSLRTKIASKELRASFMAEYYQHYAFYIDLLMQLHQQNPLDGYDVAAFQCTERVRARSLLEILTELKSDIRSGVDPDLCVQENNLLKKLDVKEQYLGQLKKQKNNEAKIVTAEKELRALLEEYNQLQTQIRTTSPKYAALIQPQYLNIQEIQQLILDDETILLDYAFGDRNSFAWVVTRDSIFSHQLPKQVEIETIAKRVYELLTFRNLQLKDETKSKKQSLIQADLNLNNSMFQLSQMILMPVIEKLTSKRLLIVCEGALQYIPFGALPIPGLESDAKPPISVLSNYEIISLPSASVVPILRQGIGKSKPDKIVAVLADPVFSEDDPRMKRSRVTLKSDFYASRDTKNTEFQEQQFLRSIQESGLGTDRSTISRLPFSRQEANSITALVPPEKCICALDFDASYVTATSPDLSQFRIVHFATHGLLNSSHPELSGIVLSLVDNQGQPRQGFLRLVDIYNMNLAADLVVLSACQTALGKDIRGEGLIGLTRGFMYAGAPRVVASLWKVDDEATAELMKRFYQYMLGEEKLSATSALRKAQISMLNEKRWQSPYYWAGFVLQGDWK